MARDFDLGISGPPMSHLDGLHRVGTGGDGRRAGVRGACWRPMPGGRRCCSRAPGWRRTGCCARAASGATAIPRKFARRSATPTTPTAWPSIRRPPRSCGSSGWRTGLSTASVAATAPVRPALAGHAAARAARALEPAAGAGRERRSCSGRWPPPPRRDAWHWSHVVTFATAAVSTSMIAFGGLSWALDGAAAPAAAVLRLREAMGPAGRADARHTRRGRHAGARDPFPQCHLCLSRLTDEPVLDGFDLTIPAGSSLAIVGQNGAGKTTLAKLLCRLYDPAGGRDRDRRRRSARARPRCLALARHRGVSGLHPLRAAAARQRAPAGAPDDVI